ncbi:MAG TPA: transposase [Anaerolineae bacterium]|nr:transposase [Anaerolineae bacterium]
MANGKRASHSSDLRKGRCSIPGQTYFITKCVMMPETDFLIRPDCAQLVIESFQWAAKQTWWVNLGFVVMPDHYHLIVGLGKIKTLSDAIKSVNKFTGRCINDLIGNEGRFWQEGFHDHAIRNRKQYNVILAYIHNNPVKAGLVERPELWPYSTANERYAGEINWDWLDGMAIYPGDIE